ncbi:MAG: hypothetical protein KGS44_15320 [Alphaproteobacteria bacterium]|nr:hypothetical protein [Alphaproteobacteria bacterium]
MSRAPPHPDLFAGLYAEEPRLPRLRVPPDESSGGDPERAQESIPRDPGVGPSRSWSDSVGEDPRCSADGRPEGVGFVGSNLAKSDEIGIDEFSPGSGGAASHDGGKARNAGRARTKSEKASRMQRGADQPSPAGKPVSTRMTITLPKGPVLAAIKREAAKEGLSVSQAAFRALARGARRAELDVEDRLNRLEASLAAHRKATGRDFALTQELVAALAQLICERLPVRDLSPMLKAAAARDVEAMLRRVVEATGRG